MARIFRRRFRVRGYKVDATGRVHDSVFLYYVQQAAFNYQYYLKDPGTFTNNGQYIIQLFRAIMATLVAAFTIRALRGFDVGRRRQLDAIQQEAQKAISQRVTLRGELLHRSVTVLEEERSRIAHDLHDEIGQRLTGLATSLRGVQSSLNGDPDRARSQLRQLEGMTVADLRPSLLDDMGLHAALGWYVDEINRRSPMRAELLPNSCACRLPLQVETTLFRITQEALTNVIRHADARRAELKVRDS